MRLGLVFGVVGQILRLFCLAFLPPALMGLRDGLFDLEWAYRIDPDQLRAAVRFAVAGGTTWVLGTLLARAPQESTFRRAEALAVVVCTWLSVSVVGAVPYVFAGIPPVDALFESVSGFTTTGATILQGVDFRHVVDGEWVGNSRAFFLWRAMTQWFGGLGVIALFVVVLPRLGIAGRQIMFAEASRAPGEAVSPSVRQTARKLWVLYTALTLLQAALLWWSGYRAGTDISDPNHIGAYEAFVHSLTTLSAGGFSPNGASVMGYENAMFEWIFVPFMFVAGASYPLMWRGLTRNPLAIPRDGEFKLYSLVAIATTVAIALLLAGGLSAGEEHWRAAAFQITSLISSAGFASEDYELWGHGLKAVLVIVMIMGGCAGSAAGGAKEIRFLLVFKSLHRELMRVLHPRAVIPVRHGGEPVSNSVMWAVFSLVLLYVLGYGVVAVAVTLLGADLDVGFSASVACLSNVGPAFGEAGPMGTYGGFGDATKLILTGAMFVGRLEIVTVLALFHPDVWRQFSLRARTRRRS